MHITVNRSAGNAQEEEEETHMDEAADDGEMRLPKRTIIVSANKENQASTNIVFDDERRLHSDATDARSSPMRSFGEPHVSTPIAN